MFRKPVFKFFSRRRHIPSSDNRPQISSSPLPLIECLEGRQLMSTSSVAAQALLGQALGNIAATVRRHGARTTVNQFGNALGRTTANAMRRGGMGWVGQMNSNQAYQYVMNSPLGTAGLQRDPVTGFNPVTDLGSGFTYPVYQQVSNNIARRFARGATNIDYTGVMNAYGLTNVPGSGAAGADAYLSLGVVQNGTSFLARRPDGSQALPSDYYNMPYNNDGVFNPSGINYSNVYNNPYNW